MSFKPLRIIVTSLILAIPIAWAAPAMAMAPANPFGPPVATHYRFTQEGPELGELHAAKTCIDYHFCGPTRGAIVVADRGYRFHTDVSLTQDELSRVFDACASTFASAVGLSVQDLDHGARIRLPPPPRSLPPNAYFSVLPEISFRPDPANDPAPRDMRPMFVPVPAEGPLQVYRRIEDAVRSKDFTGALRIAAESFRLPTAGYSLEYDPEGLAGTNAAAVTTPGLKKVRFSASGFTSGACWTVVFLRHELEHVQQNVQVESCKAEGKASPFDAQIDRERSAYMNDLANAPILCPGSYAAVRKDRQAYLLRRYRR